MKDLNLSIEDRARAAAYYVCGRCQIIPTREEFKDICQSAALGWVMAQRKRPGKEHEGYAVIAARNEAMKFILNGIWGKNPFIAFCLDGEKDAVPMAATESCGSLPDDVLQRLNQLFLAAREKKGARGMLAASRDTFIINAVHQGWNNEAIGLALGIPARDAATYRRKIRRILKGELS